MSEKKTEFCIYKKRASDTIGYKCRVTYKDGVMLVIPVRLKKKEILETIPVFETDLIRQIKE